MATEIFDRKKQHEGACNSIFEKKIIPPMPSWVSKKNLLPSNGGGVLDGD
jgi:hypothetical protein